MPDVVATNAAYWESLAPHRPGATVEDVRAMDVISADELAALGNVDGRRCLQVAASVGDEALQLALMGAEATAVDIAPSHVATGLAKAGALGVEVDFRVADMTDLPEDVRGFDVIYISWGGLCWVPDLGPWVHDMAQRLAPGGRLVIAEHHPLWEVLSVDDSRLRVSRSYVDQGWRDGADVLKQPEVVRQLGGRPPPSTSFVWSIGAVVTALLAAGLVVVHLQEHALASMYPGLPGAAHLPATYVAAARKPTDAVRRGGSGNRRSRKGGRRAMAGGRS